MNKSNRYVSIIAPPRSGTTALGEFVKYVFDAAYWIEPKYIWLYKHDYRKGDTRSSDEATPGVRIFIKKRFDRYLKKNNKRIFLEKTPSNVMRLEFVAEVIPSLNVIWLLREPMEFAHSYKSKGNKPFTKDVILRRLKNRDMTLDFIIRNSGHIFGLMLVFFLSMKSKKYWGIKESKILDDDDLLRLWIAMHTKILRALENNLFSHGILLTYDDLIDNHPDHIARALSEKLRLNIVNNVDGWNDNFERRKHSKNTLNVNQNLIDEANKIYTKLKTFSCFSDVSKPEI